MKDMAYSTLDGYRKILDAIWRPEIGSEVFEEIVYSRLPSIAAAHTTNKTIHDCDLTAGKISINKAVILRREKDRAKTGVDREIVLCGRAYVMKRQLKLREPLVEAGKINHDLVFFDENGAPIVNLSYPYRRWAYVLESRKVRYREPYNGRHSFISWRLMIGHNVLLVAQEDGHSVATMLKTCAPVVGPTRAELMALLRACEALRNHVRGLMDANLRSWERGRGHG